MRHLPLLLLLLASSSDAFFFPGHGFGMPPCRCFPMMCPPRPPPVCPIPQPCPCGSGGYPQPPPEPTYQIAGGSYETQIGYNRPTGYVQPPTGYPQPQGPPPLPYPSPPTTDGYVSSGGLPSPIQPDASAGGSYVDSMYEDSQNQQQSGDSAPSEQPIIAYSTDNDQSSSQVQTESSQTEVGASTSSNGYRNKARAAKTVTVPVDPKCNSSMLRKIMDMKINENPAESKRAIARAAIEEFLVAFDVICSTGDFSYLANSRLFCEHKVRGVTCFAFQH